MTRYVVNVCLLLMVICSCSSTNKLNRPEVSPEIPTLELEKKHLVAINPKYKRSYFRIIPYLFLNRHETFNEIQGDFYNVDFHSTSNINIMPGYFSEFGQYKNVLAVSIAMSHSSKLPLKEIPILVESGKHGTFIKRTSIGNQDINRTQQRVLFIKELELTNQYNVIDEIFNDIITVKIGAQIYKFLSPESDLD